MWVLFIKSDQLLARYLARYAGKEEKIMGLASGLNPARAIRSDWQGFLALLVPASASYPAYNPAGLWPDSDVSVTVYPRQIFVSSFFVTG